jgi:hypothetical protein
MMVLTWISKHPGIEVIIALVAPFEVKQSTSVSHTLLPQHALEDLHAHQGEQRYAEHDEQHDLHQHPHGSEHGVDDRTQALHTNKPRVHDSTQALHTNKPRVHDSTQALHTNQPRVHDSTHYASLTHKQHKSSR